MYFSSFLEQLESFTKQLAKTGAVVAYNGQSAAAFRTVEGECCDDHMPQRLHGLSNQSSIGGTLTLVRKEVECRSVVPQVDGGQLGIPCNVGHNPFDASSAVAQPRFGTTEALRGDI